MQNKPHIVIVGGGFGGLYTAKSLRRAPVDITLIDRHNYHLFQPLLYQVATGGVSPSDIASPLRAVFTKQKNTRVIQANVVDIDPSNKQVILQDGTVNYDILIVATGVHHHYFGNDDWEANAPGLKTIEDALNMRRRIFLAFEAAERETNPKLRQAWMTFVVVGAGPTGVELSGALGELAHRTLRDDFRAIDPHDVRIFLLEGQDRVLPPYPVELSAKAAKSLESLGVTIRTGTFLTDLADDKATLKHGDETETIDAKTVLWAAGIRASSLGGILQKRAGAPLDKVGRVMVNADLRVPNHHNLFVVGDLAHFAHGTGEPLPGVAQVAMQQGEYLAKLISAEVAGTTIAKPFQYNDRGSLAVIGRNKAVAQIGNRKFSGFLAWLIWVFIHIAYLIEFDNRLIVMVQWAADYFTRKRGARLITGDDPFPLVENKPKP
jgi:NADH dehydrogenase